MQRREKRNKSRKHLERNSQMDRTYRISDVVSENFLRFPLSLLANTKYKEMSLEAKFIYSLLLNRLTLSQKNNWINENKEVYLIYTREDAAKLLNITYKKTIAAFKELSENGLLYEQRQGRGLPNLIYVLKAETDDTDSLLFGDEYDNVQPETDENDFQNPLITQNCRNGISRTADLTHQELSKEHIKTCENGTSRTAEIALQDMPKPHPIKNNSKKTEDRYIENSQSVNQSAENFDDRQADEQLKEILRGLELHIFKANIRTMLVRGIERLFYSEKLKIGNAVLPQQKIRSYLNELNTDILISCIEQMKQNESNIINPTAYLMSLIINTICEQDSDLILNLPPGYVANEDIYESDEGGSYDGS